MSDTVDNVLNTVSEAAESEPSDDVVVSEETTVEEAPVEEVAGPEPVAEEVPVEEEPEPEPEPVVEEVPVEEEPSPSAPAPSEPVSTQEVVQNVQEILSSTETNVSGNDLENRVKVLEERLESLISVLKDCSVRSIYEFI